METSEQFIMISIGMHYVAPETFLIPAVAHTTTTVLHSSSNWHGELKPAVRAQVTHFNPHN